MKKYFFFVFIAILLFHSNLFSVENRLHTSTQYLGIKLLLLFSSNLYSIQNNILQFVGIDDFHLLIDHFPFMIASIYKQSQYPEFSFEWEKEILFSKLFTDTFALFKTPIFSELRNNHLQELQLTLKKLNNNQQKIRNYLKETKLEQKVAKSYQELAKLYSKKCIYNSEISKIYNECSLLKFKISQSNISILKLYEEASKLKPEVLKLNQKGLKINHEILSFKKQVEKLKHVISELNHKRSECNNEISRIKNDYSIIESEIKIIQKEMDQIHSHRRKIYDENIKYNLEYSQITSDFTKLYNQRTQLKDSLNWLIPYGIKQIHFNVPYFLQILAGNPRKFNGMILFHKRSFDKNSAIPAVEGNIYSCIPQNIGNMNLINFKIQAQESQFFLQIIHDKISDFYSSSFQIILQTLVRVTEEISYSSTSN